MTETVNLSWDDDLGDIDEEVSEEIIKNAESMGKVPVGRYFCECIDSVPRQKDFDSYSCIAANLRWNILKVLSINNVPVEDNEYEEYENRSIFDDIALYNPNEKEGMRKRRILVAKRTGLINDSSEKITKKMWQKDIIGKKVIINYVEEEYMPKNSTIPKKSRKVDFFGGYESADGIAISDMTPDIDDI